MEKDEIIIKLTEIGNGWTLHIFNRKPETADLEDTYHKTLEEALKAIPEKVAEVRKPEKK